MAYTPHPDYEDLPEIIRYLLTPEQFAWLGNVGRERLVEDECYPEVDD